MTYLVIISDQQEGPFTVGEIKAKLAEGVIDSQTLVWAEGWVDWLPVGDVESLGIELEDSRTDETVPKPDSGFLSNLKKGAEIAKKQAEIKKLQLGDLKKIHAGLGQLVLDQNSSMEAFTSELARIAEMEGEIETLSHPPTVDPNAKMAEKAKATAAAAKAKVVMEATRIKRKGAIEAMGVRAIAEVIPVPGGEGLIAESQRISEKISGIQAEISALGAGAHPLAKHPFLVMAALAAVVAIVFFAMRDDTPAATDYAAIAEKSQREATERFKEEDEKRAEIDEKFRKKQEKEMKARQAMEKKEAKARVEADEERMEDEAERTAKLKVERAKASTAKAKQDAKMEAQQLQARRLAASKRAKARNLNIDPLFVDSDFVGFTDLARKLYRSEKPIRATDLETFLLVKFSTPGFKRLQAARKADVASQGSGGVSGKTVLAAELNEIIRSSLIYDKRWFPDSMLATPTRELLEEVQLGYSSKYVRHLNRLLLENAFGISVRPTVQIAIGQTAPRPQVTLGIKESMWKKEREFRITLREKEHKVMDGLKNYVNERQKKFLEMDKNRDQIISVPEWLATKDYSTYGTGSSKYAGHNKKMAELKANKQAEDLVEIFAENDRNADRRTNPQEYIWALEGIWDRTKSKGMMVKYRENSHFTELVVFKKTLALLKEDAEAEAAIHSRANMDRNGSLDLNEFIGLIGDKFEGRKGDETNRKYWESMVFREGRTPSLSWHQRWFTKLDLNDDGMIDVEEWKGGKGLGKKDLGALQKKIDDLYVYVPDTLNAAPKVYAKVKSTFAFALTNRLVTAKIKHWAGDISLEIEKSDMVKGMDLYLSLQEGAILIPKDSRYSRLAVWSFGGSGSRVAFFPGRNDDPQSKSYRSKQVWGVNLFHLDVGKPQPPERSEFTLQTSFVNELGALFYSDIGTLYSFTENMLMALVHLNPRIQKEELEMHVKTFPDEARFNKYGLHKDPRFEVYLKTAMGRVAKFRADKDGYMAKEKARIGEIVKWGNEKKKWNLFSPILPESVADQLVY
ncbi:GYF domain-containing protein [Verrucomicrobia bacterium]|nr:GYF domain-containing protein [Verrucomicrobiota bacterium]